MPPLRSKIACRPASRSEITRSHSFNATDNVADIKPSFNLRGPPRLCVSPPYFARTGGSHTIPRSLILIEHRAECIVASQVFDVVVIGSGPGGYEAAVHAAQM